MKTKEEILARIKELELSLNTPISGGSDIETILGIKKLKRIQMETLKGLFNEEH